MERNDQLVRVMGVQCAVADRAAEYAEAGREQGVSRPVLSRDQADAHLRTVSQVRVVMSLPKVFSIRRMKTGPSLLGK